MKIVHISDLHHASLNFVKEWGENALEIVNSSKPDIVVLTGDLTNMGYIHEYDIAKKYVDRIEAKNKIIVPGNHDARNAGHEIFEEIYGTRFPYFEEDDVMILGLDSTEPDIDDGHIGRENYDMIDKRLSGEGKLKILALHHHLIAIPGTGRERNIAVDAGQVLRLITEQNVDFVLSGHKHLPWVWKLEDTYLITAGTATSRRLKGRSYPSFNMMHVEDGDVLVEEINVAEKTSKELLKVGNVF